jgi:hypothetical protein
MDPNTRRYRPPVDDDSDSELSDVPDDAILNHKQGADDDDEDAEGEEDEDAEGEEDEDAEGEEDDDMDEEEEESESEDDEGEDAYVTKTTMAV